MISFKYKISVPCGYIICIRILVDQSISIDTRRIVLENKFDCLLKAKIKFISPNKTKHNEKKTLIALKAMINSLADLSIASYQFQIFGTKKCHIPKLIVQILAISVESNFIIFITPPLKISFD